LVVLADLVSSAIINAKNELDLKYNTPYGQGIKDLISNTRIPAHMDDFFASFYVEPAHTDGPTGTVYNPYKKNVEAIFRVTETALLDIKQRLLQPPQLTYPVSIKQDTYTRQAKPTTSYGQSHSIVVGKAVDGEYRGFIEFDLTNISNLIVKKGMNCLKLTLTLKKITGSGIVDFYEVNSNWYENYLMWITSINYNQEPVFSYNFTRPENEIDIRTYVLDLLCRGKTKLNLMLRSDNFLIFNSKESGSGAFLTLVYTDPAWTGAYDFVDKYCQAIIRAVAKKDIAAIYRLSGKCIKEAEVIIKYPGTINGRMNITRLAVFGKADIVYSKYLNSSVLIRHYTDLNSEVDFKGYTGYGSVNIPYTKHILSSVYVKPEEDSTDTSSNAEIIRKTLHSFIDVVKSIYTVSSLVIRKNGMSDLLSESGLTGWAAVGQANITLPKDMYSIINIRTSEKSELISSLFIQGRKNLKSAYVTRRSNKKDIFGYFIRPENIDLFGESRFIVGSDAFSSMVIRKGDSKDTIGLFINPYKENLTGSLKFIIGKDVFSSIVIRKQDQYDILSSIIKRLTSNIDVYSDFTIPEKKHLISSIEINQIKDLLVDFNVRQYDIQEFISQLYIHGWLHNNIISGFDIAVKSVYLGAATTIKNNFRIWRPNIEGQLDFQDRKLPRIWRREDFLPIV
jgi:hypothetical protein